MCSVPSDKATVKIYGMHPYSAMAFHQHNIFRGGTIKLGNTSKWIEIMYLYALDFKMSGERCFSAKKLNNRWCSIFQRLKFADKEGECRLLKLVPGGVIQEH